MKLNTGVLLVSHLLGIIAITSILVATGALFFNGRHLAATALSIGIISIALFTVFTHVAVSLINRRPKK